MPEAAEVCLWHLGQTAGRSLGEKAEQQSVSAGKEAERCLPRLSCSNPSQRPSEGKALWKCSSMVAIRDATRPGAMKTHSSHSRRRDSRASLTQRYKSKAELV